MKSILDHSFRYTPSFNTDIRMTFDRLRSEQLAAQPAKPRVRVVHIEPRPAEHSPAHLPVPRVA